MNQIQIIDSIFNLASKINKAPQKIKLNFDLINLFCWIKKNNIRDFNYNKLAQEFNLSDTTVRRFLNQELENHKLLHKFIAEYKICEIEDKKERFVVYMLDYVLKKLSLVTIKKNKFFNDFYKLGVSLNKIEYKSIYTKNSEKDMTRAKSDIIDIAKKQEKLKKLQKSKKIEKIEKIKILKPIKYEPKTINILATTKSSDTLKQLAKDFNCKIKEIDNRFGRHDELVYSTNPGKYYY